VADIDLVFNLILIYMIRKLVIIGGGYAGFWSALSAIRQSRELEKVQELEITLINTDNYFTMRPRLYEVSLEGLRVELDKYLQPLGIKQILGRAEIIKPDNNEVIVSTKHGLRHLNYDYLILAAGSSLKALNLPGIENTFNIDTFDNAKHLEDHVAELAKSDFNSSGDSTFVVAGGGLTGLEAVTSIAEKARIAEQKYSRKKSVFKVILVERDQEVGAFYDKPAREYLLDTLKLQDIEIITSDQIKAVEPSSVTLGSGRRIETSTVIWTIGMTASPLTAFFDGQRDQFGRLKVDEYLKLAAYENVIIAGDVAQVTVDKGMTAVMSCQFSQWQGRWAGHNAVNDLFGEDLKQYIQIGYNTCLDLGPDTALITDGWDRVIHKTGEAAKATKKWICTDLIYPSGDVEQAVLESVPHIPKF